MINSTWRGHKIIRHPETQEWLYADNLEPVEGNNRPCGNCGRAAIDDDIDPCLGRLPGVQNACCGHGEPSGSWVQFENGVTVRGFTLDPSE